LDQSIYGFNLRAIFAGQLGGTIFDLRKEIMYNVDGNFNVSRDLLNRFRPGDDPSVYKFPTTVTATPQGRWPNDTRLTDGSYIALKNLTLGYNLGKILKNKSFKSAELYMSMRNVFYIANYKEGNPEIRRSNDGSALRSVNYGSYPIGRTTTFGLNVTF
jgi:TonB-dependent starch-binding outer membrane protein SusC